MAFKNKTQIANLLNNRFIALNNRLSSTSTSKITDTSPNSIIYRMTDAFAEAIENVCLDALSTWGDIFTTFLSGLINLPRIEGKKATVTCTITLVEGSTYPITLPDTFTISDANNNNFIIQNSATNRAVTSDTDHIRFIANDNGSRFNSVRIGALNIITTPHPSVQSVTNIVVSTGGRDVETDLEYRLRLQRYLEENSFTKIRNRLLSLEGVNNVKVIPPTQYVIQGNFVITVTSADTRTEPTTISSGTYFKDNFNRLWTNQSEHIIQASNPSNIRLTLVARNINVNTIEDTGVNRTTMTGVTINNDPNTNAVYSFRIAINDAERVAITYQNTDNNNVKSPIENIRVIFVLNQIENNTITEIRNTVLGDINQPDRFPGYLKIGESVQFEEAREKIIDITQTLVVEEGFQLSQLEVLNSIQSNYLSNLDIGDQINVYDLQASARDIPNVFSLNINEATDVVRSSLNHQTISNVVGNETQIAFDEIAKINFITQVRYR